MLADPQFDAAWRNASKVDHDVLDVPVGRCLGTLSNAGIRPAKFGTVNGNLRGLWFIAANLVHDMTALNKMEMLRWDVWGAMPHPDTSLKTDELAFFDHLAALTRAPDASFEGLRRVYEATAVCECRLLFSMRCETVRNPLLVRPPEYREQITF